MNAIHLGSMLGTALIATAAHAQCVDFDTPPGGAPWSCCGTIFTYNGIDFRTEPFLFFSGMPFLGGWAEPTNLCNPDGSGLSLWPANVNVAVDITNFQSGGVREVRFDYHDFGGSVNLSVNGLMEHTKDDFAMIAPGTFLPVGVEYTDISVFGPAGWEGTVILRALGDTCIEKIAIGGQELCIDDLCFNDPCGCAGDITGPNGVPDGNVDALDFLTLIAQWGAPCPCSADITGPGGVPDGTVDALDFLLLISQWGSPANCQ